MKSKMRVFIALDTGMFKLWHVSLNSLYRLQSILKLIGYIISPLLLLSAVSKIEKPLYDIQICGRQPTI